MYLSPSLVFHEKQPSLKMNSNIGILKMLNKLVAIEWNRGDMLLQELSQAAATWLWRITYSSNLLRGEIGGNL